MKIGDKVWIPVSVIGTSDKGVTEVKYSCYSFWVDNTDIKTATADDYRNALSKFHEMNANERTEIWGLSFLSDAHKVNAEEFVCKLRKHQDEPKTGQIWKTTTGKKIVVLEADEHEVRYYRPCGNTSGVSRNCFDDNFRNTGEVLISVATFLKDLEGLNEG